MTYTQLTDAELSRRITAAQNAQAELDRLAQLRDQAATLSDLRAEQQRRAALAAKTVAAALEAARTARADVQAQLTTWKGELLALLRGAPTPPKVNPTAVAFGNGIPAEYREQEAAFKARLSAHVNALGALVTSLPAAREALVKVLGHKGGTAWMNFPPVRAGLTERETGRRWFEFIQDCAGRWAAYL